MTTSSQIQSNSTEPQISSSERSSEEDRACPYVKFTDIFYNEGDSFNFTNEIKYSIDTNNS